MNDKLRYWQDKLRDNDVAYSDQEEKMDRRERLYRGDNKAKAMTRNGRDIKVPHIRNICSEIIEAQVSTGIPAPKVTPRRKEDEALAKTIEDMLRNELDRLQMERINDMMERTVPIQGGAAYLVEWDNTKRTHTTVGEVAVSAIHPKKIIPQDGVYSGIEDMDYVFLKIPQTKEYIKRQFGKDVSDEAEEELDIKGIDDSLADDMVTMYVAYYRNDAGGIGKFSWVRDTVLEDIEDYQSRRIRKCVVCGAPEPMESETIPPTKDGTIPGGEEIELPDMIVNGKPKGMGRKRCPYCGSAKWEYGPEDYEEVWMPILRSDGTEIPGASVVERVDIVDGVEVITAEQHPTRIPYYKPNIYPVILQKNVTMFGSFLGESDIDKIETQQNTVNRIEKEIIDKLLLSGSYITLPDDASIRVDDENSKVIRPGNIANKQMIGVYDMQGNIQQDMAYLAQVYEEARQIIGITDSFQGRQDATATSGVAKEFSARQAAGRMESKRAMKEAAYADLFEAIFKFKLAYADEPRPVVSDDINGEKRYSEFNRYDFLKQDEAGEWYWNDQFLFSCDTSAPLASNREAMWQETRMNLQTGAFGNPADIQTLILFWAKMEMLHYPGAGETKAALEERAAQTQQMQIQQPDYAALADADARAAAYRDAGL